MCSKNIVFLLIGYLVACCDSAFLDTLQKCDITDEKCVIEVYMGGLDRIGANGVPELNIPSIDPLELNNFTVSVLGLLDITLFEATVKGFTDCVYNKFKVYLETKRAETDITCDMLTIEGHYKVATGPVLQSMMGDVVHGDGSLKFVLEKTHLTYDFAFVIEKDDKGRIFFMPHHAESTYTFEVLEKATLQADNVHLGSQEISNVIVVFFNENWTNIMKSFGKFFSDKAVELYFEYIGRYFNSVPAEMYLTNDFTSLV